MKRYMIPLLLVTVAITQTAKSQTNFVAADQAEVLLITHAALRTPGWYVGMPNAWETKLLNQKTTQGLSVGLYQIGNGVTAQTILSNMPQTGQGLRYLLIIGDADRNERDASNPNWPVSNADSNRFVPLFGGVVASEVMNWGNIILENDFGYLTNLNGVTVGRIPAQSLTEINTYLDKSESYLEQSCPQWVKRQALIFDDIFREWTGCAPGATNWWEHELESRTPSDWTTQVLRTSSYSDNRGLMEAAFQGSLNEGCGLITTLGAAAGLHSLNMFYFWNSPYQFSTNQKYPLVLALNCDVGSIQRPRENMFDRCVAERLLFQPSAGPIAVIAPTGSTLYHPDGWTAKKAYNILFDDNVRNFGHLWERLIDLRSLPDCIDAPDWQWLNLILLGDPSLNYPLEPKPSGQWTASESPIHVCSDMVVESSDQLSIGPGVTVLFSEGASLTIADGARLEVAGTSQNPVVFACSHPDSTWDGIKVLSDDRLNLMQHVIVRDVESVGVLVHKGYLRMENCEIDGMDGQQFGTLYGAAFVYSDGFVLNSEIHGCERIGLFVVDNRVICNGNDIHDNGQGGVRFVRGDHVLAGNDVSYNGTLMDSLRQPWSGVEILGASVGMRCNTLMRNAGPGVFAFAGGFGSMSTRRWNQVHNNMGGLEQADYDYGQIHLRGGHVSLNEGYNSIYDGNDARWLVRNAYPVFVSHDMTRNYWGTTDTASISSRLPEFTGYQPFLTQAWACGTIPPDSGENDVETVMFHSAWDMEHQGLFEAAASRYDSLINYYKSKKYSKPSLDRLAFCKKASGWSWDEVRAYFFQLAGDSSKDESLVMQCKISAAWCLANMEDFIGCANELQALLDTAETETEIVSIQIDLLMNELKQNHLDGLFSLPGQRGMENDGLDAAEQSDDMVAEKVTRFANALDDVIAGRTVVNGEAQSEAPPVPTSFALHQNYPNPFNPSTEFSFDLPEGSIVELKVFDILGREVATVVDKYFEAGTHHIAWDSRSTGTALASGVYVYQIKTPGFTDAKKMILLR